MVLPLRSTFCFPSQYLLSPTRVFVPDLVSTFSPRFCCFDLCHRARTWLQGQSARWLWAGTATESSKVEFWGLSSWLGQIAPESVKLEEFLAGDVQASPQVPGSPVGKDCVVPTFTDIPDLDSGISTPS